MNKGPAGSILLVEDNPDLAETVGAFLEANNYLVDYAADGVLALHLATTQSFDAIVLDVMLPDINGKEVCQRVRSDSSLESVKIICISGMVEQGKVADLKAAGADDFMHKPFTVDRLLDRACDLLEMERAVTG